MHDPGHDRVYTGEADEPICDCIGVLRSEIDEVISEGAQTVESVGELCGAGGGCGSCHPEIARMLMVKALDGQTVENIHNYRRMLDEILRPLALSINGTISIESEEDWELVLKVGGGQSCKQTISLWAELLVEPLLSEGSYLEVE